MTRATIPSSDERLLDRVARRPRDLRDERALLAEQRVEQRRLPGVRRPDDRDAHAFADEASGLGGREQRRERVADGCQPPNERRRLRRLDFVGEIDRGGKLLEDRLEFAAQPPRFAARARRRDCAAAARAADRCSAAIKSATASAAVRSSFPARNARRVNSPGLGVPRARGQTARAARRARRPASRGRAARGRPRPCSCAAPRRRARAPRRSSRRSRRRRAERRAPLGERPPRTKDARADGRASGPLTRTIAIAPRPGGVAIAAIVSALTVRPALSGAGGRRRGGPARRRRTRSSRTGCRRGRGG